MATTYLSGGKIGDFLQQLSVVYERFLLDNKPAVVYICERGDTFRHGVHRAYTDLTPIMSRQPYIKEFKIHQGEPYDFDLTRWRNHIDHDNYLTSMKKEYNVDWGKNRWLLNIPIDPNWRDCVVVNTTHYRFPDEINWQSFFEKKKTVFVGFEKDEYIHFKRLIRHHNTHFYCPSSLFEMCVIIASCKLFIGSLSAPLSLAFGLHVPLEIGFFGKKDNHPDYRIFHNMKQNII